MSLLSKQDERRRAPEWSAQEQEQLRQLIPKYQSGNSISWVDILPHFPGRTRDALRAQWYRMNPKCAPSTSQHNSVSRQSGWDEPSTTAPFTTSGFYASLGIKRGATSPSRGASPPPALRAVGGGAASMAYGPPDGPNDADCPEASFEQPESLDGPAAFTPFDAPAAREWAPPGVDFPAIANAGVAAGLGATSLAKGGATEGRLAPFSGSSKLPFFPSEQSMATGQSAPCPPSQHQQRQQQAPRAQQQAPAHSPAPPEQQHYALSGHGEEEPVPEVGASHPLRGDAAGAAGLPLALANVVRSILAGQQREGEEHSSERALELEPQLMMAHGMLAQQINERMSSRQDLMQQRQQLSIQQQQLAQQQQQLREQEEQLDHDVARLQQQQKHLMLLLLLLPSTRQQLSARSDLEAALQQAGLHVPHHDTGTGEEGAMQYGDDPHDMSATHQYS